ncbi:MAG: hypothetical protein WBD59_02610, partial [Candidatus Sulfotelmatobacter sp.]
ALGAKQGLVVIYIEIPADFLRNNGLERSTTVSCLPDCRGNFIEREESRVGSRHYHHFAAEHPCSDGGAAGDIFFGH